MNVLGEFTLLEKEEQKSMNTLYDFETIKKPVIVGLITMFSWRKRGRIERQN